jgi:hypothetical protein
MILLDFRQTVIANLMVGLGHGQHTDVEINEGILRHMILKSVKSIKTTFGREYGSLVIANEGKNIWRKDVFPYYKANRKKGRDDSTLDWGMIFRSIDKISAEIEVAMPYMMVTVDFAEADDVIGTLVERYNDGNTLIVSGDKDFIQLQKHSGVKQWDHVRKRWLSGDGAVVLKEKVIRGDVGDGVPNFLSDDDTLVTPGKRSKPIMQKKLDEWIYMKPEEICVTEQMRRNWQRNETLVDLSKTPKDIKDAVSSRFVEGPRNNSTSVIREYFIQAGLKQLMADIGDF